MSTLKKAGRKLAKPLLPKRKKGDKTPYGKLLNAHMYKLGVLVGTIVCFVFIFPTSALFEKLNLASVLPGTLALLANEERSLQKLPALSEDPLLSKAATLKAQDMARKGYFAHNSPDGKTPWYFLDLVGYEYTYAGENLAINFSESNAVTKAWMNSPTHRANIVKESYTHVGSGVATGTYQGRETLFVVQLYANPRNDTQGTPKAPTKPQESRLADVRTKETFTEMDPTLAHIEPKKNVLGAMIEKIFGKKKRTEESTIHFSESHVQFE